MEHKHDPDKDSLLSVAKIIAPALVGKLAPMNVKHYVGLFKTFEVEVSDKIEAELQLEELIFSLHLLGRLAHSRLMPEKRDYFMDVAVFEAREILSRKFENVIQGTSFCDSFDTLYNSRQEQYASYRFSAGDSSQGDLFWEHANSVVCRVTTVNALLHTMVERSSLQTCKFLVEFLDCNLVSDARVSAGQERSLEKHGLYHDETGALRFDLTLEEQSEVKACFEIFKDYSIKNEVFDDFSRELTAFALSRLADRYFENSQTQEAIYTASKAASISHCPIYTFDLAALFETSGERASARISCRNFLEMLGTYTPCEIDKLFNKGLDLKHAAEIAHQIIDS